MSLLRLAADLTSIRALFNEKEKELSMAAAQVEELTRQLDQFQQQQQQAGMVGHSSYQQNAHPGSKAYFVQLHLERLRAELMVPTTTMHFRFLRSPPHPSVSFSVPQQVERTKIVGTEGEKGSAGREPGQGGGIGGTDRRAAGSAPAQEAAQPAAGRPVV